MDPLQSAGDLREEDRWDIGATLYFLLAEQAPFQSLWDSGRFHIFCSFKKIVRIVSFHFHGATCCQVGFCRTKVCQSWLLAT
jgi:hypothetical protein